MPLVALADPGDGQGRIDQKLADRRTLCTLHGVAETGRDIAAGGFPDDEERRIEVPAGPATGAYGVLERRRVAMFGRQPIVRNDGQVGPRAEFGADVVVAVEAAENETAAMEVEDDRASGRWPAPVRYSRTAILCPRSSA